LTLCKIGKLDPGPDRILADGLLVLTTPRIDGVGGGGGVSETVGGGGTSEGGRVGDGIGVSVGGRVAVNLPVALIMGAKVIIGTVTTSGGCDVGWFNRQPDTSTLATVAVRIAVKSCGL